jgi:hypothetical protein
VPGVYGDRQNARPGRQQFLLQHHAVPLIGAAEMEVQLGDEPARVPGKGIEPFRKRPN